MRSALPLAILLIACAETPAAHHVALEVPPDRAPPQEPALPRRTRQLLPDDLSTSVRGMAPVLLVPVELTPEQESAVTSALSVVRWPSREPMPAHVELQRRDPSAGLIVHRFQVVPDAMLGEGWYAVAVDLARLPGEIARTVGTSESAWPGHLVARFATHRTTVVSALGAERSDEHTVVRVRLSARVRDTRSGAAIVRVTEAGRSLACTAQNDRELAGPDGTYEIVLHCPPRLPVSIDVDPALRSLDGVALGEAYGGPIALEVAESERDRRDIVTRALRL
ncbi:MAG: hypothetical protein IT378_20815 [Sandaracinaceae bacterium]|nr:hypothetical protein [Sandaracinaceae bacterium]